MTFGEHLEELRRRLLWAVLCMVPILGLTLYFGDELLEFVLEPARARLHAAGLPTLLLATGPMETLWSWLKVAWVACLVLGLPILAYQLWLFVAPGLYAHERRIARLILPLSALLSLLGLVFLYYVMLPAMLTFLIRFGTSLGQVEAARVALPPGVVLPVLPVLDGDPPDPPPGSAWINRPRAELRVNAAAPRPDGVPPPPVIRTVPLAVSAGIAQQYRVREYVDLVFALSLAFVIGFQTPVVVLLLGWMGLFDLPALAHGRRYAFFLAFLAAAILTPSPDPFSMTLLALPLYLLYELGMVLLRLFPAGGMRPERTLVREGPDAGEP